MITGCTDSQSIISGYIFFGISSRLFTSTVITLSFQEHLPDNCLSTKRRSAICPPLCSTFRPQYSRSVESPFRNASDNFKVAHIS